MSVPRIRYRVGYVVFISGFPFDLSYDDLQIFTTGFDGANDAWMSARQGNKGFAWISFDTKKLGMAAIKKIRNREYGPRRLTAQWSSQSLESQMRVGIADEEDLALAKRRLQIDPEDEDAVNQTGLYFQSMLGRLVKPDPSSSDEEDRAAWNPHQHAVKPSTRMHPEKATETPNPAALPASKPIQDPARTVCVRNVSPRVTEALFHSLLTDKQLSESISLFLTPPTISKRTAFVEFRTRKAACQCGYRINGVKFHGNIMLAEMLNTLPEGISFEETSENVVVVDGVPKDVTWVQWQAFTAGLSGRIGAWRYATGDGGKGWLEFRSRDFAEAAARTMGAKRMRGCVLSARMVENAEDVVKKKAEYAVKKAEDVVKMVREKMEQNIQPTEAEPRGQPLKTMAKGEAFDSKNEPAKKNDPKSSQSETAILISREISTSLHTLFRDFEPVDSILQCLSDCDTDWAEFRAGTELN